ncbi:MAG TPA: MFS transporter [Opitutaceae bacterium]
MTIAKQRSNGSGIAQAAFRFVLIFGIVNLFADFTYEGARSITGAFLGSLGATATAVGLIAGLGELVGNVLRLGSGLIADRTGRYWTVVFVGYAINLLAVPALALAGNWPAAAALMILERTGRAIRKPAVGALLSDAGESLGSGWVFGLNEALDQTGATIGPLVVAWVLFVHGGYHRAFASLLITAVLCLATIAVARRFAVREVRRERPAKGSGRTSFSGAYWLFVVGGALVAAGFADFALVAYHLQKTAIVNPGMIPVYYAAANATGAISSLLLGRWIDRWGLPVLLISFAVPAAFAPLVLLGAPGLVLCGVILWGLGMAAQETLLKAILSDVLAKERRATGFGTFDACFGVAWFAGSAVMGWLYDKSIPAAAGFSVAAQLLALPFFLRAWRGFKLGSGKISA